MLLIIPDNETKIGKATYSESLIYEAYGGLQNDGIMLAVYYDVDAAKIIHQLDSEYVAFPILNCFK